MEARIPNEKHSQKADVLGRPLPTRPPPTHRPTSHLTPLIPTEPHRHTHISPTPYTYAHTRHSVHHKPRCGSFSSPYETQTPQVPRKYPAS